MSSKEALRVSSHSILIILKYMVAECIIRSMSSMIIDRKISTNIMLNLIVTFDQGNQYRMRRNFQRLFRQHSVLRTGNGSGYLNHSKSD